MQKIILFSWNDGRAEEAKAGKALPLRSESDT